MVEAKRRLAAILAADVVGYSRLMGDDESATVETLNAHREVFRKHTSDHDGRIVDTASTLSPAVFDSVIEAVQCAVDVQGELAASNGLLPEERAMDFRIGINLGDVIAQADGTVYGDGVNVAARLESLAEPGGVTISEAAYRQIEGKADFDIQDAGEHDVKNIARPVRAFRVAIAGSKSRETAAPKAKAGIKPALAVLPFENLSRDSDQDFIADGIAEDLITELSRLRWLQVTARTSSFTYKEQTLDVREIARELGVRYVVNGSVRRGGNRVRIAAQLIDAETGNHIWAEKYDRELDDIFALQDEIAAQLAAAIGPEIGAFERQALRRRPPDNLTAWESYQRGLWHTFRFTADDLAAAGPFFERAIEFDPELSQAHAWLGFSMISRVLFGHVAPDGSHIQDANAHARRAIELDGNDPIGHFCLGRIETTRGHHGSAIERLRRAIELNANLAYGHYGLGMALLGNGQAGDALGSLEQAKRLSPRDPLLWGFEVLIAGCHTFEHRFEEALAHIRLARQQPHVGIWTNLYEAVILGHLGRGEEAAAAIASIQAEVPEMSMDFFDRTVPGWHPAYIALFVDGLRKAGMVVSEKLSHNFGRKRVD